MSKSEKESLIGLTIHEVELKLGYWWSLESVHVNWPYGWYRYFKAPNKYIELRTNSKKVVISVS